MLTDIQQTNLQLVTEIDALCARHDVGYYLAGGSVIGALRHEGFIPWDDDIDVYMTRNNWEKFCAAFEEEHPQDRFLHCSTIDPEFPNTIGQYGDTNTMAVYRHLLTGAFPAGISVDIFILDPVPASASAQAQHLETLLLYADLVNPYVVYSRRFDVEIPYERYLERIETEGRAAVLGELERKLASYDESECECYSLRWGGVPHFFAKELFGAPQRRTFEGVDLPLPQHAHKYLTCLYGEEWNLLPQGAEVFTHNATMSATQSYKRFFEVFLPQFDTEAYLQNAIERKKNHLAMGAASRAVEDRACEFEARRAAMRVKAADEQHNLLGLYAAGKYDELWEHLCCYVDAQCCSRMWGDKYHNGIYRSMKPAYSDIGDDLVGVVVDLLARKGEVYRPRRLLEVRASVCGELAGELAASAQVLALYNRAVDAAEQGECEVALDCVERALAQRPEWPALIKLKVRLLQRTGAPWGQVEQLVAAGKTLVPNDGAWAKFEADALWEDDVQAACELYERARANTRDGVLLLEIGKRLAACDSGLTGVRPYESTSERDATAGTSPSESTNGSQPTPLQLKQCELVVELVDMCAQNDIPCYLADKTALAASALAAMPGVTCCPTIAVPMRHCSSLLEAISAQHSPQRVLDLQPKDTKRAGFTARYVARDTLWLDVRKRDAFEHAGIHVTIVFIEHEVGGLKKMALERDKKRFAAGKLDADGLSKALSRAHAGAAGTKGVWQSNRRKKTLDAAFFSGSADCVSVYGHDLPLPHEAGQYLEQLYGAGYVDSIDPRAANTKLIVDTEVGYADFREANSDLFEDETLVAAADEWTRALKLNKEPERIHQEAWQLATCIAETLANS